MEYKHVLNPYAFNNEHVYSDAFRTLLLETYPSTPMTDIPVSS